MDINKIPERITKKWLQSLSDDDLAVVVGYLGEDSANYQNYNHARSLSNKWERAYDEQQRRKSQGGFSHPKFHLRARFRHTRRKDLTVTVFGFFSYTEDLHDVYAATDEGGVIRENWTTFLSKFERSA